MNTDNTSTPKKRDNLVELSNEQKNKLRQRVDQKGGQKAVAELTTIPAPTLSKILALDTYQRVNQNTIQILLDALDLSDDFQEEKTHLKIGFGFTLWSAPVILGLHTKGWFRDCDLSSFYKKTITDDEIVQHLPQWDEGNGEALVGPWADGNVKLFGKSLFKGLPPEEAKVVKTEQGDAYRGFTAHELLASLEDADDSEFDGIIVPRDVIANREHEFSVVASMIYSVSGSTIISMITKKSHNLEQIGFGESGIKSLTSIFFELIKADVKNFVIFYPPGTICEHHYKEYIYPILNDPDISKISLDKGLDRSSFKSVKLNDIADPHGTAEAIQGCLEGETKTVAFLLGWLPNNTWTLNCLKDVNFKSFDLLEEMSQREEPGYFEFSLITRNEDRMKRKWMHHSSSREFLRSLSSAVNKINSERSEVISRWVRTKPKPKPDRSDYLEYFRRGGSVVPSIAHYLNLPINETAISLNSINFSFSINADFFLDNYQPALYGR